MTRSDELLEKAHYIINLSETYACMLTDHQKKILNLYFVEDYSLAEIALEQQVSRQAVHVVIRRAVNSLRKWEENLQVWQNKETFDFMLTQVELLANTVKQSADINEPLQQQAQKVLDIIGSWQDQDKDQEIDWK